MIQEAQQKYSYPCIAKYIQTCVTKCQMCFQNERINNDRLKTELLNCPEWDLGRKTFYKWIFFLTFRQAEDMTTTSQQKTCSHATCLHIQ